MKSRPQIVMTLCGLKPVQRFLLLLFLAYIQKYMRNICLLLFSALLLVTCSKKGSNAADKPGTFVFYKTGAPLASWSVLVNGTDYGEVPYVSQTPRCNANEGLRVELQPGRYTVGFRSNNGYAQGASKEVYLAAGECKLYPLQ